MKSIQLGKWLLWVALATTACVPARKFEEVKEKQQRCEEENKQLKAQRQTLDEQVKELNAEIQRMEKVQMALKSDTTLLGKSLRKMTGQYEKINSLNDELLKKQAILRKGAQEESKRLLSQLEATEQNLQKKEDQLVALEQILNNRKQELDQLKVNLENREQRVNELESILSQRDSAMKTLRSRVADALLSFKDKGLSIEQKDGKIYVRLEAKLLFASGSTKIDKTGRDALLKLAKAIGGQKDLKILVEGHTDTDKVLSGSSYKDNWDLSVLRATAVTRLMVEEAKIDPKLLTAAGRSEYLPVDSEDKAKNRRIEIILIPDLNKLFEVIETETK